MTGRQRLLATAKSLFECVVDASISTGGLILERLQHFWRWVVTSLVVVAGRLSHDVGADVGDGGFWNRRDRRRSQPDRDPRGRSPEKGAPDHRHDLLQD